MTATAQSRKLMSAATLSGYLVRSRENEDLGCIEEFIVVPDSGRIAYAVLSLTGTPGIGAKLVAVPWCALELHPEERVFRLNVNRESIEQAPAFDEEDWPDFGDEAWALRVHNHYGLRPYWESA